ncbi:MAG: F-box protein [Alphaproteobacteria bacterium]
MTSKIAFSGVEEKDPKTPNKASFKPGVLIEVPSTLDLLPSEIIQEIFQWLRAANLKNVRLVKKQFNELATQLIKNINIPSEFSNLSLQAFKPFLRNLQHIDLQWEQKPSGVALGLFHHVPVNMLQLVDKKIDAQDIQNLAPHLPATLQKLLLSVNNRPLSKPLLGN